MHHSVNHVLQHNRGLHFYTLDKRKESTVADRSLWEVVLYFEIHSPHKHSLSHVEEPVNCC